MTLELVQEPADYGQLLLTQLIDRGRDRRECRTQRAIDGPAPASRRFQDNEPPIRPRPSTRDHARLLQPVRELGDRARADAEDPPDLSARQTLANHNPDKGVEITLIQARTRRAVHQRSLYRARDPAHMLSHLGSPRRKTIVARRPRACLSTKSPITGHKRPRYSSPEEL